VVHAAISNVTRKGNQDAQHYPLSRTAVRIPQVAERHAIGVLDGKLAIQRRHHAPSCLDVVFWILAIPNDNSDALIAADVAELLRERQRVDQDVASTSIQVSWV
jgi:hypothetical protein